MSGKLNLMIQGACLAAFLTGQSVFAGVLTFTDRAVFESRLVSMTLEDFENNAAPNGSIRTFGEPLNELTSNSTFPNGIASGMSMASLGTTNLQLLSEGFSAFGQSMPSDGLTAEGFQSDLLMIFRPNVSAVGFDYLALNTSGTLTVSVFNNPSFQLGQFSVDISPSTRFFGVVSTDFDIDAVTLSDGNRAIGEIVDNVTFGNVPEPTSLAIFGVLSIMGCCSRRRRATHDH